MRIQKQNSGVGIAFHWEERSPYRPRLDFQFLGLRGQQMLDRKRGKKSDGTEPVLPEMERNRNTPALPGRDLPIQNLMTSRERG